jgi:cellulose synthase/poly-beta-1,6-N-acetylglucosamine synthase-like glycosyltransferase
LPTPERLPTVSIIVPVKDEEKVVGRLLDAFLRVDYPPEKMEIIVVEDGSTDKTVQVCMEYVERYPGRVKLVRKPTSNGKPSALNFGLKHVRGEVVGVFDADSVPEPDILKRVAAYFEGLKVEALQGRTLSINADENMLTKLISYEDAVRYEAYIRGKDALGLFVPLTGSCYFVRRSLLLDVGGWNDNCLSEDTELAVKLLERGVKVKYAADVRCWQENPSRLKTLFRQRTRWFRGSMEAALKYGRLLRKPDRRSIDAELTLAGPFMFIPCLLGYLLGAYSLISPLPPGAALGTLAQLFTLANTATLLLIGATLSYAVKPRRKANLLWALFVYAYWIVQTVVAVHAFGQTLLKRPVKWEKTEKTGTIVAACLRPQP